MDRVRAAVASPAAGVIEFSDTSKTYRSPLRRAVRAVEGFSLRIETGEIMGLAGPNGAGKSTLIALLLGYLRPSEGEVRIGGLPPRAYIERNGIGYMSELVTVNPRWGAESALQRYALLAGIPGERMRERVNGVIDALGLAEHREKSIKALSKGNLQRLGLAQALLGDQAVVILDEPTHGLDPVWTQRFRDIVGEMRAGGRTILMASHNLDELERVCDRVAIIDRGRLQRTVETRPGGSAVLAASYRIAVTTGGELVPQVFPDARELGGGEYEVNGGDAAAFNRRLATLIGRGALLASVVPAHSVLEQQFLEAIAEPAGGVSPHVMRLNAGGGG